jgi:hypothetical protein
MLNKIRQLFSAAVQKSSAPVSLETFMALPKISREGLNDIAGDCVHLPRGYQERVIPTPASRPPRQFQ